MSIALIRIAIIMAMACLVFLAMPAQAAEPPVNHECPPMPGGGLPGNVSVNVITADTHARVADAFVAIVNATDTTVIYATGHTFPNDSCTFPA